MGELLWGASRLVGVRRNSPNTFNSGLSGGGFSSAAGGVEVAMFQGLDAPSVG